MRNHPWLRGTFIVMEIFKSTISPKQNLAGVFEFDGTVGYFYLYKISDDRDSEVLDAIHILSRTPDFTEDDVEIRWDNGGQKTALFIKAVPWALFDSVQGKKYGGNYEPKKRPSMISELVNF
jgi:hypothetical protein